MRADVVGVDALRQQLVVHLQRPVVLRVHRSAAPAQAPVVAGGRGAVLPDLAGGRLLRACAGSRRRGVAAHLARAGRAVDGLDGVALRRERLPGVRRPEPRLLRHRLPRHGTAHRRRPRDRLAAGPAPGRRHARGDRRSSPASGIAALLAVLWFFAVRRRVHAVAVPRRLPRPRTDRGAPHRDGHASGRTRSAAGSARSPGATSASGHTACTCGTGRSSWSPGRAWTPRSTEFRCWCLRLGLTFGIAELELPLPRDADPSGRDRPLGQGLARFRGRGADRHATRPRRHRVDPGRRSRGRCSTRRGSGSHGDGGPAPDVAEAMGIADGGPTEVSLDEPDDAERRSVRLVGNLALARALDRPRQGQRQRERHRGLRDARRPDHPQGGDPRHAGRRRGISLPRCVHRPAEEVRRQGRARPRRRAASRHERRPAREHDARDARHPLGHATQSSWSTTTCREPGATRTTT